MASQKTYITNEDRREKYSTVTFQTEKIHILYGNTEVVKYLSVTQLPNTVFGTRTPNITPVGELRTD